MAGNQTVANSLAGLGQQIGQTIENQAAAQSAKAMLPVIQSQYATGMQKISSGDSTGIADVTQAAGLAGQNPLTQHLSNQFIAGATQANENYRNQLLTDTRLQTAGMNLAGKTYAANLAHPTDAQGNPIVKQMNQFQQTQMAAKQVGTYNNIWNGIPATPNSAGVTGASTYAENLDAAIKEGKPANPEDIRGFASALTKYKDIQSAMGPNAINNDELDAAANKVQNHIADAQEEINKKISALPKGTSPEDVTEEGKSSHPFFGFFGKRTSLAEQKQNIDAAANNFALAKNPMALQYAQKALQNGIPQNAVEDRLKKLGIDPSVLNKQNQQEAPPQAPPQAQASPTPAPSNQLPAMQGA